MANLLATNITGSVFEKITAGTVSVLDKSTAMFDGSSASLFAGKMTDGTASLVHPGWKIEFDPHNADKFIVVWPDADDSDKGTARIGTINGTTITWGPTSQFHAAATQQINVAWNPYVKDQFIVIFRNSGYQTTRVGTVNGTTISAWSSLVNYANADQYMSTSIAFDPSIANVWGTAPVGTKFVIAFRRYGDPGYPGEARVGTLNGTTITFGTTSAFSSANVDEVHVEFIPNDYVNNISGFSGKFIVTYSDETNGGQHAIVGTINQVNPDTISWGSSAEFHGAISGGALWNSISFDPNTQGKFVVCTQHYAAGYSGVCSVGNVSGTTITFGTAATFSTTAHRPEVAFDPNTAGRFVVIWRNTGGGASLDMDAWVNVGTVTYGSPDTIAYGTAQSFADGQNLNSSNSGDQGTRMSIDFDKFGDGKFGVLHGMYVGSADTSGNVIIGRINAVQATVDLNTGNFFTLDFGSTGGDIEDFVFSNADTTSNRVTTFTTKIKQYDAPFATRITDTAIKWPGGDEPALTSTKHAVDVISFTTYDGSVWYAEIEGQDIK